MTVSFPECCPVNMWAFVVYQFYFSVFFSFCHALAEFSNTWPVGGAGVASFVYGFRVRKSCKVKSTQKKTYDA